MKKLLLIALFSSIGLSANAEVSKQNVFDSLAKYCIPAKSTDFSSDVANRTSFDDPSGKGGTCTTVFEGIYNKSTGGCDCYRNGDSVLKDASGNIVKDANGREMYHLKWDASIRRCRPNCAPGHFASVRKTTIGNGKSACPSGYMKSKIERP